MAVRQGCDGSRLDVFLPLTAPDEPCGSAVARPAAPSQGSLGSFQRAGPSER
jgi:hypothetical protein